MWLRRGYISRTLASECQSASRVFLDFRSKVSLLPLAWAFYHCLWTPSITQDIHSPLLGLSIGIPAGSGWSDPLALISWLGTHNPENYYEFVAFFSRFFKCTYVYIHKPPCPHASPKINWLEGGTGPEGGTKVQPCALRYSERACNGDYAQSSGNPKGGSFLDPGLIGTSRNF